MLKKRHISLIIVIVMIVSLLSPVYVFAEGEEITTPFDTTIATDSVYEDNFTYEDTESGIKITGYNGTDNEIIIPSNIEGKTVIEIESEAFLNNLNITAITIPETVVTIGESSFRSCKNLNKINFAENSQLESIDDYAFADTGLTSIIIPDGVLTIGDYVFEDCNNLETIEIPSSTISIGIMAHIPIMEGNGSIEDPYQIEYIEQLQAIGSGDYELSECYILVNNLDFQDDDSYYDTNNKSEYTSGFGFKPIGDIEAMNFDPDVHIPFSGVFDGNEKTITNLYINRSTFEESNAENGGITVGLFGGTMGTKMNPCIIKDIELISPNITGANRVGALAGASMFTKFENCHISEGIVTGMAEPDIETNIEDFVGRTTSTGGMLGMVYIKGSGIFNCSSDSEVVGTDAVGGLVGYNYGNEIVDSFASGIVSGDKFVGGLSGCNIGSAMPMGDSLIYIYAKVKNSFSDAKVIGLDESSDETGTGGLIGYNHVFASVRDSYSIGNVEGKQNTGGLVGHNNLGLIENCFSLSSVEGTYNVGGLVGKHQKNLSGGTPTTEHNPIIRNCIAYNNEVNAIEDKGRIIGNASSGAIVSTCYSRQDMNITESGSGYLSGSDISENEFQSVEFYTEQDNWDTTDSGTIWDFDDIWMIGENAPIYIWNNPLLEEEYTVTFKDYDETILKQETVIYQESATPPSDPTREGYTFVGWDIDYSNVINDITITAQYNVNQYTITYESNGGSVTLPITADFDSLITLPNEPTKTGYEFLGWYKNPSLTTIWDFITDKVPSTDITLYAKWNKIDKQESSSGSSSNKSSKTKNKKQEENTIVIVNGKKEKAGKERVKKISGEKVVEVKVYSGLIHKKIQEVIKNQDEEINKIEIPILTKDANKITTILTGDIVKTMDDNNFTLSIDSEDISYVIPAKEVGIENIAKTLDIEADKLNKIEVEIKINEVDENIINKIEKIANKNNQQIILPPVNFEVIAKTKITSGEEKQVTISKFNQYVKRVIKLPEEVDINKVTTGIVYNEDGNFSHVPTNVLVKDGIYYAQINSLTNSSYSAIWNPITVESVDNHWSEVAVNDMASRLIIKDPEEFMPDQTITRGEFAEYITRALGIYRTRTTIIQKYSDVEITHELANGIQTASEYNIISGYPDGSFKPNDNISREEAMVMYSRAMNVVDLESINNNRLQSYNDKDTIADWAYNDVQKTISTGIFNGKDVDMIKPKYTLTYAEAATAIRNLLIASKLINE